MEESILINQGAATSASDTDLVMMSSPGGVFKTVPLKSLMAQITGGGSVFLKTPLDITGGDWVRVAKAISGTCSGILTINHGWNSGRPVALICAVNGSMSNVEGCYAEQMTGSAYYKPSSSNNLGLSFTAIRFVKENNALYFEVRLKQNTSSNMVYCALGASFQIELIPATVSNASASDVWKTIEFSGGVKRRIPTTYVSLPNGVVLRARKGGRHDRGNTVNRSAEECTRGRFTLGVMGGLCRFLGRSTEGKCHHLACSEEKHGGFRSQRGGRLSRSVAVGYLQHNPQCTAGENLRNRDQRHLLRTKRVSDILSVCNSLGDIYALQELGGMERLGSARVADTRKEVAYG